MKKFPFTQSIFFCILAELALAGCVQKIETSDPRVRFESIDCQFQVPFNPKIECGDLFVPEDRGQPDGQMIQIHVAIIKSSSEQPAPDPIVILQGGPGVSALGMINYWLNIFESALKERDLIVFDQRGVGYSQPVLNCPEMEEQFYQYLPLNLSIEEEIQFDAQAAQFCHDRLVSEGIQLSAYTSAENAADVADMLIAMGYDEWNLYGSSYGTRLALTVMRDFPQGIRSVIIDSVYPPQVDIYADFAANAERSFNLLFERCAAYPRCEEAYPDLEKMFYEIIDRLDEQPVTLKMNRYETGEQYELLMDGRRLINILFNILYDTSEISNLPKMIYQMYNENWNEPTLMIKRFMFPPEMISEGMQNSVECGEEAPFSSEQLIDLANANVNQALREALVWPPTLAICTVWDVSAADKVENESVISDIPTLILAGGYDPVTPPAWGKLAAETLSQAQFFEFSYLSHGVLGQGRDGGKCTQAIFDAFITTPMEEVDGSCIDDLRLFFLTR